MRLRPSTRLQRSWTPSGIRAARRWGGVPTGERPQRTGAGLTLADQAPELLFTLPDPHFLRDCAGECGVEAADHLAAAMRLAAHLGGTGQAAGPAAGPPDDPERPRQAGDSDRRAPRMLGMGREELNRALTVTPLFNGFMATWETWRSIPRIESADW